MTVDTKKGAKGKEAAKRPKIEDDEPLIKDKRTTRKASEEASALVDKKGKTVSGKDAKRLSSPLSDDSSSELDKKLEKQAKAIWALKDDLKKNVVSSEMRTMLDANSMDVSGTELELRDRW